MKNNKSKFVFKDVLYEAKIVDGGIVISDADGKAILEADLTSDLKEAAVEALAAKPEFELITVREREISRGLFLTKKLAHAAMLEQLKAEFEDSGEDDTAWDEVLEGIAEDGEFVDSDFGINENIAWSSLGDNIDWRIFPLEGDAPIVNAEYNLWWDDRPSIATPCKINLRTKQVFAITDSETDIDSLWGPDEEYVSFFGMEALVYNKEDLDPEFRDCEFWHE